MTFFSIFVLIRTNEVTFTFEKKNDLVSGTVGIDVIIHSPILDKIINVLSVAIISNFQWK